LLSASGLLPVFNVAIGKKNYSFARQATYGGVKSRAGDVTLNTSWPSIVTAV
jgi:hypothetical protein